VLVDRLVALIDEVDNASDDAEALEVL